MSLLLVYAGLGSFAAISVGVAFSDAALAWAGVVGITVCWLVELGRSYLRAKTASADLRSERQRRAGRVV